MLDRSYKINNTWVGFDEDLENLTRILNKNQFPTRLINNVTKKYLNLKLTKGHLKTTLKQKQILDFSSYHTLAHIPALLKKRFKILLKLFAKVEMLKLYLRHLRSVTSSHTKIHYHFIFNHSLFTNLFVQTVKFVMWVKPQGTSSPESMSTYRKALGPTSLNISENRVHAFLITLSA